MTRQTRCLAGVLLAAALLVSFAAAQDERTPEEVERARTEAMLASARSAFCQVHYWFHRPEDEKASGRDSYATFPYDHYIEQQTSLLTVGILMDGEGHVLVGETGFEDKYIDRIEVVGPDGTVRVAERASLLVRAPGELLMVAEPPGDWQPPEFADGTDLSQPGSAFAVGMQQVGKEWFVTAGPVEGMYDYAGSKMRVARLGPAEELSGVPWRYRSMVMWSGGGPAGPVLLCDAEGRPVGVLLPGFSPEPGQETGDWAHERLLNGPAISAEEFDGLVKQCEEAFGEKIHECKILYRMEGDEDEEEWMQYDIRYMMMGGMGSGAGDEKEWKTYGLVVGPKQMLVPYTIGREQAARIDTIEITVGDEVLTAAFGGAFEDVGGFLVELTAGEFGSTADIAMPGPPARMEPFLTVVAEEKFGEKHFRVRPNRWLYEERGYKGEYYVHPVDPVPSGAWVVTRDLEVAGLYARQRIEGEEIAGMDEMGMRGMWMYGMDDEEARIFWASELAPMLADPVAHYDPHIKHKTEEEAKRVVWLGVEYDSMERELAEQLGVEEQTKDGSVGLYVKLVYPGSPAERLGIQQGDILLRVETPKRPEPIELGGGMGDYGPWSYDFSQYMDYEEMEEYGVPMARWPSRRNYLVMLLQAIGEGETVELTYLRDGEKITEELAVELAPPDFVSAPKYKNKAIGLTVKDLTYEVRSALRLAADKQAVVVSKTEPGSPAEVAQVGMFELITAIDGEPVGLADEFGKRIDRALAEGKGSVRLTIETLGKTRFADLDITPAREGVEEEEEEVDEEPTPRRPIRIPMR